MASLHGSSAILAMDPRNSPRHQQRRQRIGSKRSSTCENQWKVRVMKLRVRVESDDSGKIHLMEVAGMCWGVLLPIIDE